MSSRQKPRFSQAIYGVTSAEMPQAISAKLIIIRAPFIAEDP
jgi:hypothetical protein